MEEQLKAGYGSADINGIRLQQLIDGLVGNSLPTAMRKGSVVVNEVGRGVVLRSLDYRLTGLLDLLLNTVIENSRSGDIHITAERRNQELVLYIQERNNYNGYALSFSIGALADDAAIIGGRLEMQSPSKLTTTISLSLPLGLAVAA